jgi:hypothetical protein
MYLATGLSKAQAIDMWQLVELLRKRPFAHDTESLAGSLWSVDGSDRA